MSKKLFRFRENEKIKSTENKNFFNSLKKYRNENKNLEDVFYITDKEIIIQNYVGLIPHPDFQIELFPKINLLKNNEVLEKKRFLEILYNVSLKKNITFKFSDTTIKDLPILEIFIHSFLDELKKISKMGLLQEYINKKDNLNIFRGKICIKEHIKYNSIHKERFFVSYDELSFNIFENILLKFILKELENISIDKENKKNIKIFLKNFNDIDSVDKNFIIKNLINFKINKKNYYYKEAVEWSLFFINRIFSLNFSHNKVVENILLPMEKVFETYISNKFKHIIEDNFNNILDISLQDNSYSIFSNITFNNEEVTDKDFKIKPDIVIKNNINKEFIVLDTKWKILKKSKEKYNIDTEDIYQIKSYVDIINKKNTENYTCRKAYLLFPFDFNDNNEFTLKDKIELTDDNLILHIIFIDLSSEQNTNKCLSNILKEILK